MTAKIIGWDIGGAHAKAVLLDSQANVISALQVPCSLWQGLEQLEAAVHDILRQFSISPTESNHAVTMTGELADIFPHRRAGVIEISKRLVTLLGQTVYFYTSQSTQKNQSFIQIDEVPASTAQIASANWHASANYIAEQCSAALLVDIGSTTTDIIPMIAGAVIDVGSSDASRMQQDSLVYTGIVRTPVMALAHKVMFDDAEMNVAGEYFATMADVYRLTDELHQDSDMAITADGKSKTKQESARRLARMIGYDVEDKSIQSWVRLALSFRAIHIKQIEKAVVKHVQPNMPIIGAGVGAFLARLIAKELGHAYVDVETMIGKNVTQHASICLPAYAVAYFALQQEAA